MKGVEYCKNWLSISIISGLHCWNCAKRNGYPRRAQPSYECKNFQPKEIIELPETLAIAKKMLKRIQRENKGNK